MWNQIQKKIHEQRFSKMVHNKQHCFVNLHSLVRNYVMKFVQKLCQPEGAKQIKNTEKSL